MAVLTIAREFGAIVRGEELTLCNTLGLKCVSKATLEKRFADLGISSDFLSRFDECKPGFVGSMDNSAGFYWETLRTVVMQELLQDDVAIFGRGGNFLLKDLRPCLRIRLIAPLEFRIEQVAAENSIPENQAEKLIRQSDSNREKFCNYYYGMSWRDPSNYDMVINTATIPMESVAELLAPVLQERRDALDREKMELMIQGQIIKHTLYSIPELQLRFLDVVCEPDGKIILNGTVASRAAKRRVDDIVQALPGVKVFENRLSVVMHDIPLRLPPLMH